METRRVQRLNEKPKTGWHAKLTQAWGGGMLQMSDAAWEVTQKLFDIHHMGAAEYEFGALPIAFQELVRGSCAHEYEAWSYQLRPKDIKPGWWREKKIRAERRAEIAEAKEQGVQPQRYSSQRLGVKAGLPPVAARDIYVISPKRFSHDDVMEMLKKIAHGEMYTKNDSNFGLTLDPEPGFRRHEHVGWFDIDNVLLWFVDKTVWEETIKVFLGEEAIPKEQKA